MNVAPALLAACARRWLAAFVPGHFDLIDAHYVYPDGVAALWLARRLGRKLVITARGSDVTQLPDHAGPRAMIRYALRRADALIAVSAALGARLVALGADPTRVHVLRNGVDLSRFRPPPVVPPRGAELLSVGHLITRKGHQRVIEALARLPPAARLTIVGEGPLEGELLCLATRLGVAERVRFAGVLPPERMPEMYGAADVLVLASSREGWANVLLEAMACGTPVVASPIAGNDEVVRSSAAGLLAAANTADALAEAIARLLAAPPERSATRVYAEGFGWPSIAEAQVQLYRNVLGPR
jgi:glycosyltransferase involved in cell wall biosynthesis